MIAPALRAAIGEFLAAGATGVAGAIGVAGLISGCATGPAGIGNAGDLTSEAQALSAEPPPLTAEQQALLERRTQRIDRLLSEPLSAENAAEIALLQNPAVERALETLDMPGFDRLLLAYTVNPAFNNGQPPSTVETRIERPLSVNALTWVSVPALAGGFTSDERAPRLQAADEIVALLYSARRAWVQAVAARQTQRYLQDVAEAAEAGRDIMEGMRQVGNASELELLRAQTLHADAVANLTAAQLAAAVERERLIQTLGLWGADADRVQLPERLVDLPPAAIGPESLEDRAVAQRFDVRAGRIEGLAGEAGVNARADVRTAWLAYRASYDLAQHARDALVPLARRTSAEQLKLYNGMLIDVFDLVSDATERINAVNAALEAQRNFWLAEVELQRAMAGVGSPGDTVQPGAAGRYQPGNAFHVH